MKNVILIVISIRMSMRVTDEYEGDDNCKRGDC